MLLMSGINNTSESHGSTFNLFFCEAKVLRATDCVCINCDEEISGLFIPTHSECCLQLERGFVGTDVGVLVQAGPASHL